MAWIRTGLEQLTPRARGIAAILLAVTLLSLSDALVKLSGDRFSLAQIVLLRSLVAGALIAAGLLAMGGPSALRSRRTAWVRARSLSLAAMWLCYYAGLPSLSFALAAACYYTAPIWMALIARFALGTPIGGTGWIAIGLSSLGVLLVVDPFSGKPALALVLPLAAAMFYAVSGTITWSRSREESAGAMALDLNLCLVAVSGLGLLVLWVFEPGGGQGFVTALWPTLEPADIGLAALLGLFLAIITTLVASAYRLAPTPVVGVFDTSYLGFAAFWSAILFHDPPGPIEAAGIALIALAGILMTRRGAMGG
ncbi:DMT family transporter [Fulvimarina endophytica]|uniref:DMT family transporter n=1 Tax=Fulvimarina endophytica TaxID=2293836 RepID=A0A371X4N7_9HYPH|nr:DMT family transporter [Fulvimarina endophytica]RFC64167.1 DMT family transporter [Fulvimarina endophytica]